MRNAATLKGDESILLEIQDKDCIALEVKYHRRCYEKYTSFVRHNKDIPTSNTSAKPSGKFEESFNIFCDEFIKTKIIEEENIVYMAKILQAFIETVSQVENEDASSYRASRLKQRLQERFPELVFQRPRVRSKSEIVYSSGLEASSLVEHAVYDSQDSTAESESDMYVDDGLGSETVTDIGSTHLKDFYNVALSLNSELQRKKDVKWYDKWPPVASEITADSVKKLVPPMLFNFMAWVVGFSDEPEESSYVKVEEKEATKILSLCQDLIYIFSHERVQTPKSLCLAIAVRQISGCSNLINILNGLGHCISLPSTMSYDSALAQLAINPSNAVPRDFLPGTLVNLVFDNIDFGEEAATQTHVTNGIIIQKNVLPNHVSSLPHSEHTLVIKKKQRTVTVPDSAIVPYNIGEKKSHRFDSSAFELPAVQLVNNTDVTSKMQKLDMAYVLIKTFGASNANPWPSWSGFNTLLCADNIPTVSRISYLPIVDGSPTEYSTLLEVLKRSISVIDSLELQHGILVCDEAVYAKVQQIRWKEDIFYDRLVVRLGEFHVTMCYLAVISKIFQDAGLKVSHVTILMAFG